MATTKAPRSPRRLDVQHQALRTVPLNDKAPPPEDSLAWGLWLDSQDLAQKALQTQYIQGIAKGTLDPNAYGQYTLQDAIYCHHAQDDYATLERRATAAGDADLAAFAKARGDSYRSYNATTFESWHIQDPSAVALSDAAQTYVDFEHHLAVDESPIYGVIGMVPCDQLWSWLATELAKVSTSPNLYDFWITDNNDWGGAYRLDNFIDGWFDDHPSMADRDKALFVFRSCMTCELNFFRSACGEALEPMPSG